MFDFFFYHSRRPFSSRNRKISSFFSYFVPICEQASVFVYFHLRVSYLTIELLCDFGEATSSFLVSVFSPAELE